MDDFTLVGARPSAPQPAKKQPWYRGLPLGAMLVLAVIILGCLSCGLFLPRDPTYMDLANCNVAPCREFLFGTDAMGRDIFSMIWYGGRASLTIGFLGAAPRPRRCGQRDDVRPHEACHRSCRARLIFGRES